jgi:hypothetical protein
MKNIHILPTDKPSRLHLNNSGLVLCNFNFGKNTINGQHIYITSDEEIRKGDWVFANQGAHKVTDIKDDKYPYGTFNYKGDKIYHHKSWKKIILTTDQDLIADNVQAIDDEFLEWFVKNPSCEEVEVRYEVLKPFQSIDKGYILRLPDTDVLEKPKQETLEEFAEEYYIDNIFCDGITEFEHDVAIRCYIASAKHTAERMYSEAIEFAEWIRIKDFQTTSKNNWIGLDMKYYTTQELFEQFKKK